MARINSFLPHILLLMSVYTATMMKAEPLIRSSKEPSPSQGVDIVDNIDTNPYNYISSSDVIETLYPDNEVNAALDNSDLAAIETLYPDNEVNAALDDSDLAAIETLHPDNEVNAALFGYLKIMSDEKPVSGSIYIRWGRDECPTTANKVYSGLAAAPDRVAKGGGSNYLCLPETPEYNNNSQSGKQERRSSIYTVKYRHDFPPLDPLAEHDIPCAVCESIGRNTMLMIPARLSCPSSEWNLEYSGFLMAEREKHYRVQYVCLDGNPTIRNDTDQRVTGNGNPTTRNNQRVKFASMQPVEGVCSSTGGLPCGSYKDRFELACTVCTK
ncbi:uncharacterized protein [Apostichopus japonicus]|uniref:uncharacterized protein n=1 Tax=Stichopus japonicus TaxID=307972 RepID=UPI003AB41859